MTTVERYEIDPETKRVLFATIVDNHVTSRVDAGGADDVFAVAYDNEDDAAMLLSHGPRKLVDAFVAGNPNLLVRYFDLNEKMLDRLNGAVAGRSYFHLDFVVDTIWKTLEGAHAGKSGPAKAKEVEASPRSAIAAPAPTDGIEAFFN